MTTMVHHSRICFIVGHNADLTSLRDAIGVLSKYAVFETFNPSKGFVAGIHPPDVVAVVADRPGQITLNGTLKANPDITWVFIGKHLNASDRRLLREDGFQFAVNENEARKTLRRILNKKKNETDTASIVDTEQNQHVAERKTDYKSLLEDYADVYVEFSRNGVILNVSPSVKRLLGIDPAGLLGKGYKALGLDERFFSALINDLQEHFISPRVTNLELNEKCFICEVTGVKKANDRCSVIVRNIKIADDSENVITPALEDKDDWPVIKVRQNRIIGFNSQVSGIFQHIQIGMIWSRMLSDITCFDCSDEVQGIPGENMVISAGGHNGSKQYYRLISIPDVGSDDDSRLYFFLDSTPFFTHVRHRLLLMMQADENMRINISDKIRDDLGALISVGRALLESVVKNAESCPKEQVHEPNIFPMLEKLYRELKLVSNKVYPTVIRQFGVEAALRQFMNGMRTTHKSIMTFSFNPVAKRFDEMTEILLFRICEEIIQKACESNAGKINIIIHASERQIRIESLVSFENPINVDHWTSCRKSIETKLFAFDGKIKISGNKKNTNFEIKIPFNA